MTEVEICVADPGSAAAAADGGADRIELCCALELGGLTPSAGALDQTRRSAAALFVTALIRPRPGDFVYDSTEAATMVADVAAATRWADRVGWDRLGFTVGALTPAGEVDSSLIARLVEASGGRRLVFHKAFDVVPDQEAALSLLGALGVEAVLTSGGGGTCVGNLDALSRLAASGPVTVVAAGGIRPDNVVKVAATGIRRVHLRAPRQVATRSDVASEYHGATRETTSSAMVAEIVRQLTRGRAR